jgi:KaiC/GvpD/RAD55 family RecA-like ATPase
LLGQRITMQQPPPNAGLGRSIPKSPTGVQGLDEITAGGLPRGRPTLVCGGAGSGKTLLAASFRVNGIREFGEHGVLTTFEENGDEIASDVASLDANASILRAELRRLFRWLKDKGVTAVITAKRGEGTLTRQGLEGYVSDAVILLDHRVLEQVSTRRLRVVKYRGSHHGTNEYPFLIDKQGLSVLPVTSLGLQHRAPNERVSSGVPAGAASGCCISCSRNRLINSCADARAAHPQVPRHGAFESSSSIQSHHSGTEDRRRMTVCKTHSFCGCMWPDRHPSASAPSPT